jgi:hypothetical protein
VTGAKAEIRMPNDERNPKPEARNLSASRWLVSPLTTLLGSGFDFLSDFGFQISDFFRHSSFVIRPS